MTDRSKRRREQISCVFKIGNGWREKNCFTCNYLFESTVTVGGWFCIKNIKPGRFFKCEYREPIKKEERRKELENGRTYYKNTKSKKLFKKVY